VIYLDTHVVAWLYAGKLELFPTAVRSRLETEDLLISPIVELELQYLFELERTSEPGRVVVDDLEREIGLTRCELPFNQVVAAALHHDWTRDPFDRLIVAQAQVRRTPLLTKDGDIRGHYPEAVWLG
jgi:PIN domain nuclease of toxin-antitoxin system